MIVARNQSLSQSSNAHRNSVKVTVTVVFQFIVKVIAKLYALSLIAMTRVFKGFPSDRTRILVDHRTAHQIRLESRFQSMGIHSALQGNAGALELGEDELLVVIPFRDRWDLTEACLHYLVAQDLNAKIGVHVVLVDNNSCEERTKNALTKLPSRLGWTFTVMEAPYAFHFSRLNNEAVERFRSPQTSYVLFLNNDVELRDLSLLSRMVYLLKNSAEVGVVGSTLLYPDRRIQHAFAVPGVKVIAAHPLKGHVFDMKDSWFQEPLRVVPAVTGAVMMVRLEDIEAVGGFDLSLPTLAQDIDLCLMIHKQRSKCSVVLRSTATFHLEGPTKESRFPVDEIDHFYQKWTGKELLTPYYASEFSRWSEEPVFKCLFEPQFPARWFATNLKKKR